MRRARISACRSPERASCVRTGLARYLLSCSSRSALRRRTVFRGDECRFDAAADLKLLQDVGDVVLHRFLRQKYPRADFLVRKSRADEAENLALPVRELLQRIRS